MNLQSICDRLNEYLIESENLHWRNWVGLQDDVNFEVLNKKTGDLFSLETIDFIRNKLKLSETESESHRLRSILGQLTLSFMENVGIDIQQEVLRKEAATCVVWKNESIPLRSFQVKILNESDRFMRREMASLRETVINKEINPLRVRLMARMFTAVKEMGYKDYVELCEETQGRDFRSFAKKMEIFLDQTESIYRENLNNYLLMTTGTELNKDSHSSDLTAVMKCNLFDADFPPDKLLPVLKETVEGLGFSLDKIHLDLEDRPNKKPRPCVSAVNPPDDVRLTIYPVGGFEDYSGLLHETGHALHFVNEKPDLDFIFKFWGDRGFTEGMAYLFQNITMNEAWLKKIVKLKTVAPLIKYNSFMGILRFRRLIGQFLYLMEFFTSDNPATLQNRYSHHFQRAHLVQFDSCDYMTFDMELYTAGYLRARMFELQLRENIVKQFGEMWWQKPAAGNFLVDLFQDGRKNRADDVVVQLGYNGLDPQYYKKQYIDRLLNS